MKVVVAASAVLLLAPWAVVAEDEAKIALPKDPKAVVLAMDYKGGFTPPRQKNDPALSILADGTVLMPDRFGMAKDVSGKISPAELQSLLAFIVNDKKFAKIDAAKMKAEVTAAEKKRGGFVPRIADAPSTFVEVTLPKTKHSVTYYAATFAARQNPTVQSLQDFAAIQVRLQRVMNVVRGGGSEKVAAMLKLANAELKKQHPKADPLTMEHFKSAYTRPDGSTNYGFSWSVTGMPGVPASRSYVNATVVVPAAGEPTVTIRASL